MSSSRVSGICVSLRSDNASAADCLQLDEQLAGKVCEGGGGRAVAGGGRITGVGGLAQAYRQGQAAKEGDAEAFGFSLRAAMAERIVRLAARRAIGAGH